MKKSLSLLIPITLMGGLAAQVRAGADPVIDATDNLFSLMLGENPVDASLILTALRSTNDAALVPVYARVGRRTEPEMQLGAMMAIAMATRDSARVDAEAIWKCPNVAMGTATISMLVEENLLTNEQLEKILANTTEATQKVIAASELLHRKALPDHKVLALLAADTQPLVRCFAAFALLSTDDVRENALGLKTLNEVTWPEKEADRYNPRLVPTQGIIVLRIRKEKVIAALPWVIALTQDEKIDEAVRFAAVETLLDLQRSEGPEALARLIAHPPKVMSRQIRVGLMALQFAAQLKPGIIAPLERSDSRILVTIGGLARQSAEGNDVSAGIVKLLNEGQPFIMDWAMMWAETAPPAQRLLLRKTLIENSAIVDEARGRDFERAAVAAQRIAKDNTADGNALLKQFLHSDNRAIVEAVLAGIYRSDMPGEGPLVMEFWSRFQDHQTAAYENSANYAALVLSREGNPAAKNWLGGMVQGGSVQDLGFRALAGWYYAKLTKQAEGLVQRFAEKK